MNVFLTGCSADSEWQLKWFIENFVKENKTPLVVTNFGMTDAMVKWCQTSPDIYRFIEVNSEREGWLKKTHAMIECARLPGVTKCCWIDTDCHIRGDLSPIFSLTQKEKLSMVEDRPWSDRRGETGKWFNSGVVCFEGIPYILEVWADECERNPVVGDQGTLHALMASNSELATSCIDQLPHTYNTLRLDIVDGIDVKNPLVMHWTGDEGKEEIRKMIKINGEEFSRNNPSNPLH